jgi:hypothetical protein
MKVENMINSRGNTVANQFIIRGRFEVDFQSYNSLICSFDFKDDKDNKLLLKGSMWDYSVTTRRYFKQFINEETPFTYETKAQWEKEIKNNDNIEVI